MQRATRRDLLALAGGLGLASVLWRGGPGRTEPSDPVSTSAASSSAGASGASGVSSAPGSSGSPRRASGSSDAGGAPARLVIPAIRLDEPVVALGLNSEGQIVPPADTVQWYTGSPAPGDPGVAVVAGHVTNPDPDVFHRLPSLRVGDPVAVVDASGRRRTFRVYRTRQVDKQTLTTDPSVWGHTDQRVLALITCDPESSVQAQHLTGNFVAWAGLVG
ncbi:class F sortase [Calidifontibacter indicus]|uniref:class F sortase n=1 Tax=Calidifontibacter indicus TaxID=419650 RepID=UPI003D702E1B